jgi:ubiquinone/menaquinone biosynthesis C-methylase UbiE
MSETSQAAFESRDYVAQYEAWYATPFGRLADVLERRMLDELLAPLAPPARVLEVGCGTAHFGLALARSGFRVVGCDPAHAMLRAAAPRVPPLEGLVQADGLRLPFADGAFEAAVLVAVLEFVRDPAALLAEARRVARERVVVLTVDRHSYLALRRRLAGRRGHPVFAHARYHTRRELVALAESAGARVLALRAGLVLPPLLAGRLAGLELQLARLAPPGAGLVALALSGGAAGAAAHTAPPSGRASTS